MSENNSNNQISVRVLLGKSEVQSIQLPEGATVTTVLDSQGFTLSAGMKVSVNGQTVTKPEETQVQNNDTVIASKGASGAQG